MFTALENEIVRVLRANLSPPNVNPALVSAGRVSPGPIDPPQPSRIPSVAFTVDAFEILPAEDVSPPRGVKAQTEDVFSPIGDDPLVLSDAPLEPLRSVEAERSPGGQRTLLRERDDYVVDYVNGSVRLRRPPAGDVFVQYFTLQPLRVVISARLRLNCRLDVWGETDLNERDNVDAIATIAMGAITANASTIDGLLTEGEQIVDNGLPSLGARRMFFIFEDLRATGGAAPEPNHWLVNYSVEATMVLVPLDEAVGLIRTISGGLAWDEELTAFVLASSPPILDRPVTLILGVGPVLAQTLAGMGITTIGQLAQATPGGQPQIDGAIGQAQIIGRRAREVVRETVQAMPEINNVAIFLNQRLNVVDAGDLTAVDIPLDTATAIVAALSALLAETSAADLRLSDLFFTP